MSADCETELTAVVLIDLSFDLSCLAMRHGRVGLLGPFVSAGHVVFFGTRDDDVDTRIGSIPSISQIELSAAASYKYPWSRCPVIRCARILLYSTQIPVRMYLNCALLCVISVLFTARCG